MLLLFRFTPHDRLDIAIEPYDDVAVSNWLDYRITEIANDYLKLDLTDRSPERVTVSDAVQGRGFLKLYVASTVGHGGMNDDGINDETLGDFEKRYRLTP